MDINDFPLVRIPGSEDYWSWWQLGDLLNAAFPGQETHDFAMALNEHPSPERDLLQEHGVASLFCLAGVTWERLGGQG